MIVDCPFGNENRFENVSTYLNHFHSFQDESVLRIVCNIRWKNDSKVTSIEIVLFSFLFERQNDQKAWTDTWPK